MNKQNLEKLLQEYDGDVPRLLRDIETIAKEQKTKKVKLSNRKYGDVVIQLKDIVKTYKQNKKDDTQVLRGINLEVKQGEFISLVGPSGSGKSTLLNIIAGLDKPTSGEIFVNQEALASLGAKKLSRYRNTTLGFVFQFFYLQPFLSLQTNVEVPLMFAGTNRRDRRQKSLELLESVGLGDRADFLPKQLSGGQMQRAAIARALINEPKIILADEPTGNLDKTNGQNIMDLFEEVRERFNTTLIVVTHDESIAQRADRSVRIEDGQII